MKLDRYIKSFLTLAITVLFCSSCGSISGDGFKVETTSPQGTYRLEFEGRREPPDGYLQSETVKLKVIKGQETIFTKDPFFREDALDPHFRELFPVLQWFGDSALRMGDNLSEQPFSDEIIVFNRTAEKLDVVQISYGRDERFLIFDFAPGAKVKLKASPQFKSQWGAADKVIYQAQVKGQTFVGGVGGQKRKSVADGALKYFVEITRSTETPKSNNSFNRTRN